MVLSPSLAVLGLTIRDKEYNGLFIIATRTFGGWSLTWNLARNSPCFGNRGSRVWRMIWRGNSRTCDGEWFYERCGMLVWRLLCRCCLKVRCVWEFGDSGFSKLEGSNFFFLRTEIFIVLLEIETKKTNFFTHQRRRKICLGIRSPNMTLNVVKKFARFFETI